MSKGERGVRTYTCEFGLERGRRAQGRISSQRREERKTHDSDAQTTAAVVVQLALEQRNFVVKQDRVGPAEEFERDGFGWVFWVCWTPGCLLWRLAIVGVGGGGEGGGGGKGVHARVEGRVGPVERLDWVGGQGRAGREEGRGAGRSGRFCQTNTAFPSVSGLILTRKIDLRIKTGGKKGGEGEAGKARRKGEKRTSSCPTPQHASP